MPCTATRVVVTRPSRRAPCVHTKILKVKKRVSSAAAQVELLEVQCSRQPHKNDSSLSKLGCTLLLFWLSFLSLIMQKVPNQG